MITSDNAWYEGKTNEIKEAFAALLIASTEVIMVYWQTVHERIKAGLENDEIIEKFKHKNQIK